MEEDKALITNRIFSAINTSNIELFGIIKEKFATTQPVYPILEFIIERLVAVTTLASQGMVWAADIVYRSALEPFLKLHYITNGKEQENTEGLHQFWEDLAEISRIKMSDQARKNLDLFNGQEIARLAYIPLLLSDEEELVLRKKWPRNTRKQLEQKWSFSQLAVNLSLNYRGKPLPQFIGFTHSYRMASHVAHGDENGVLIIKERNTRPAEERVLADFAHYLRLMYDSFLFTVWTGIETCLFIKHDPKFFQDLHASLDDLQPLIEKYHLKVFDDPLYDRFRK